MIKIESLDHFVLTVKSIEKSLKFYCHVLGMQEINFGENRKAVAFGKQKINFHESRTEFEPKAAKPTPGSANLCFIATLSIKEIILWFKEQNIPLVEGPVERTGAKGKILSIYIRDPDNNLIKISNYTQAN